MHVLLSEKGKLYNIIQFLENNIHRKQRVYTEILTVVMYYK